MAEQQAPKKPSTLGENYKLLVNAALNGADNALTPWVDNQLQEATARVKSNAARKHEALTDAELEIRARKMVSEQLADSKGLESGKVLDSSGNEIGFGFLQSVRKNGFTTAILETFGGKLFSTLKEKFIDKSNDDFMAIWDKKDQEAKIGKFAESRKISSERLMAELTTLPAGTAEAAAITPEMQAEKATKLADAKRQVDEQAARDKEANDRKLAAGRAGNTSTSKVSTNPVEAGHGNKTTLVTPVTKLAQTQTAGK